MNIREIDRLRETYRHWVDSAIMRGEIKRQPLWTGSIAVGDKVWGYPKLVDTPNS
jgi:hypothetical protein